MSRPTQPPEADRMSLQLHLPEVAGGDEATNADCLICGAKPEADSLQHRMPDGKISMSVDNDLCLECAIHVWRAAKELFGNGAVKLHAFDLLKRYSITKAAMARHCRRPR